MATGYAEANDKGVIKDCPFYLPWGYTAGVPCMDGLRIADLWTINRLKVTFSFRRT